MNNKIEDIIEENGIKIKNTNNVFYNKAQIFNRSISIEIINTYLKYMNKENKLNNYKSISILECMAASGIRSLRYINEINKLELKDKKIEFHINDISLEAIELIKYNLKLNKLNNENIKITQMDCRELMIKQKCKYNIIDIDPFGSASPFLQSAFNAIKHNGLILITCTDTAVLCSNPIKCYVKYGNILPKFIVGGFKSKGFILNDKNIQNGSLDRSRCHSMSLKILLNHISKIASIEGCAIEPLISISVDYYIRIGIRVIRNLPDARKSYLKNEFIGFCTNCGDYKKIPFNSILKFNEKYLCGLNIQHLLIKNKTEFKCKYRICGPFWTDKIQNYEFLKIMNDSIKSDSSSKRLVCFIKTIYAESKIKNAALFDYSIPEICSYLGIDCIPIYNLLSKLKNENYEVSVSHCTLNGFVSSALFNDIIFILHEFIQLTENKNKKEFFKKEESWNNEEVLELLNNAINRRLLFEKLGPMASPKTINKKNSINK